MHSRNLFVCKQYFVLFFIKLIIEVSIILSFCRSDSKIYFSSHFTLDAESR